jgi:hypothetical protein
MLGELHVGLSVVLTQTKSFVLVCLSASFIFSFLNILTLAVCKGLGKKENLYKFAGTVLEKYWFTSSENKRTEVQVGWGS